MKLEDKILVTGSNGMVGSAIVRALNKKKFKNILSPRRNELDLLNRNNTLDYLKDNNPDYIFAAAAKVGGIDANNNDPVGFFLHNINMQNNLINLSNDCNVNNLIFFGSSCIYPKYAEQPINENQLLSGYLEKTNEAYALAKICGLKLCNFYKKMNNRNYFSVMPTNLYGYNDNYNPSTSHVIPGIIKKIYDAKIQNKKYINLFGTGKALREFLHVDDLADACIILAKNNHKFSYINIGSGNEINIRDLAFLIMKIAKYEIDLKFNSNVPDGTPRKLLDSSNMRSFAWLPKKTLAEGLELTYKDFEENMKIK